MGGGSTTVEGPKKEGTSPEVVTGVLRSPDCGSEAAVSVRSVTAVAALPGTGLPPEPMPLYRHVSKLRTLKCWAAAAAADSVSRKADV